MSQIIQAGAASVEPVKSDGTKAVGDGVKGWTLAAGTWFALIGGKSAEFMSVHMLMEQVMNVTAITVEVCNVPDADIKSVVVGEWIPWNPTTVYVGKDGADMAAVALTISKAGVTAPGGAAFDLNTNMRRLRLRIVVAVAGLMRIATHGKD